LLSGEPLLAASGGFIGAARQALDKLGVRWEPTELQRAYNEGRSTQVPVNPAVRVKAASPAASNTRTRSCGLSDDAHGPKPLVDVTRLIDQVEHHLVLYCLAEFVGVDVVHKVSSLRYTAGAANFSSYTAVGQILKKTPFR
jgi:hypothetical protein